MISQQNFEYYIVRYAPNAAGGDDVRIGVILLEQQTSPEEGSGFSIPFAGVRFRKDWAALKALVSDVDLEVIGAIVEEINSRCGAASAECGARRLAELLQELGLASNGVVLGPPKGLVTADPELALGELATRCLQHASDSGSVDLSTGRSK